MDLLTGINDHGRRLDRILRKALPDCPLPLIHRLIRKGIILVNGKPASAQTRVAKGSKISIPRLAAKKIARKTVAGSSERKAENKARKPEPKTKRQNPNPISRLPDPIQYNMDSKLEALETKLQNLNSKLQDLNSPQKKPKPAPQTRNSAPQPKPLIPEPKPNAESKAKNPVPQTKPERQMPEPESKNQKPRSGLSVRFYHPPEILWQGTGLIAVNKPAGLAVHGPVSLDRMIQAYLVNKLPPSLSFKPGPLHRLDKPSSGIVVFSASLEGANLFSTLMKEHKIKKTYLAVAEGEVKEKQFWTDYIYRDKEKKKSLITGKNEDGGKKGKIAITMIAPLARAKIGGKPYSLIEAEIETGRTHQIRAQAGARGYPLAGDRKYGGRAFNLNPAGSFFLHAWKMEFSNIKIEAPLPPDFKELAQAVFKYKQ